MGRLKIGKRVRWISLVPCILLLVSALGCDDCNSPTAPETSNRLVFCGVGYRAAEDERPASMGIDGVFFGDPIPVISDFMWLGRAVGRVDEGIPGYSDSFSPAEYRKQIGVSFTIDGVEKEIDLTIPDSFSVLKPETGVAYISPDESYEVVWSNSADADHYEMNVTIVAAMFSESTVYLDSTFLVFDTTFVIPAEWTQPATLITIQLGARIGSIGEPGDQTNYHDSVFSGFVSGFYKIPFIDLGVTVGKGTLVESIERAQ